MKSELFLLWNVWFILYHSTSMSRWGSSFTYNVWRILDCHWVVFLFTFWWYNFSYILQRCHWIFISLFLGTWFLCSYRDLIIFLLLLDISIMRISNRFLVHMSFFLCPFINWIIFDMGVEFYSCIAIGMILFDEVFKELLKSIWTFGIQVLGFFHLSHL